MYCDRSITIMWNLNVFINDFTSPSLRVKNTVLSFNRSISVGASKFLGVRRFFARISSNLPGTLFCGVCLQNFSHKDHEDPFLVWPPKEGLQLFFCKRWSPFMPGFSEILPR